jgi:DNA-binding winged helix-turn-helix (wHTH) protein/TolB-like protein
MPSYLFENYEVDTRRRALRHENRPVEISASAFETLLALIENRGRVVSKQHLIERVWGGTAVGENNLAQSVSALRKIFREEPGERRFIATVAGRGYCFVAQVSEVPESATAIDPAAKPRSAPSWLAVGLMVACGILLLATGIYQTRRPAKEDCIAVLPFQVEGAPGENTHLGLMISDAVVARLAKIQRLRVRPTALVSSYPEGRKYPATRDEMLAAGRELKVNKLLTAYVQLSGNRIVVSAQLVDLERDAASWAERFDVSSQDAVASQEEIAKKIALGVSPSLFR